MNLFNKFNNTFSLEKESGSVMLEFALVLPILIMVVFAGIEYSRTFKHQQISASLSREAANLAYRNCGGDVEEKVTGCLKLVREQVDNYAEAILPGSRVILSVYEQNGGGVKRLGISNHPDSDFSSKFNAGVTSINGNIQHFYVQNRSRVVIAEAFVPFDALVPGVANIFNGMAGSFYDATIL